MRISGLLVFLVVSTSPSLCQTAAPSSAVSANSSQFATVSGSVVRLDTGQPLKKAVVTLESRSDAQKSSYDVTDEQGHFHMDNLEPSSYRLVVSRNGYVDAEYGQRRIGGSGAVLTLSAGQHMTDLVFKLARTAALRAMCTTKMANRFGERTSPFSGRAPASTSQQPTERQQRFR